MFCLLLFYFESLTLTLYDIIRHHTTSLGTNDNCFVVNESCYLKELSYCKRSVPWTSFDPNGEYCEEGTLAILTGPNADAIPLVELRSDPQAPNDQMTADWYWILLGFYTTFILIVTVRIFDPPKRRRQVRRHSHTRTRGTGLRTTLITYLLMWQHCQTVAALQICSKANIGQRTDIKMSTGFEQLPPPGNPAESHEQETWDIIAYRNLTDTGRVMLDYVAIQASLSKALQISAEPQHHTGSLVERTFERLSTVQSTCGVQRPKGTHAQDAPAIGIDPGKVPRVYLPIATSEPNDRNGLEGFEVAPDIPEYPARIDADVVGRHLDVFSFDTDIDILNEDYGLVNSWDLPARPDPLQLTLELHPSTTEKLLHPCTAPESHDTWFIFTDGSAGKSEHGYRSSWSFAIFSGRQSEGLHGAVQLVDWGGGYTDSDPLSQTWLGAAEDSIKSGESEAIMWAILWILQAHQVHHEMKVEIYSDSLTVLNAADGTWGGRENDGLTLRLRALYHLLWAVRHGRDLCIHHIRGHQGNYGNEFVDVLANAIRKGSLEPRVPNINLSHWFHGTTPNIVFAWLPFDTDRRAEETLQYQRGKLCWTPLNLPKPELQWLQTSKVKSEDKDHHYTLRLRIGSYNVGSIKESGRTALLREQAEHYGFHAIGLQETRSSIDDPVQSNYVRIISVAQQGVGGCELWLSTTLAYATANQQRCYFQRENAQVVYADSQLLLVVYHDHQLRLLFCVAHAPHSGQSPQKVQSWWANTTKQVQRYLQDNHLILLIDSNADPPLHLPHVGPLRPTERDRLRKGDTAFGTFLAQFGLIAPSTHQDYHYGEQITWISNDGSKTARDDYICVPVTWMDFTLSSTVCQHLDSGVEGFDHVAVQLDVQGILLGPTEIHQPSFDRTKLMKADKEVGQRLFGEALHVPWSTDVTTHAYLVEQHLHKQLAEHFPVEKKRRRNATFSDSTWELFGERNKLKKLLNYHPLGHGRLLLYTAMLAWRRGSPLQGLCTRSLGYSIKMAFTWKQLRICQRLLKEAVRADRARYVNDIIDNIDMTGRKSILKELKPLKLGKRVAHLGRKPIPIVVLKNGEPASTPAAARGRWREHFAEMEGGSEITVAQLLARQPHCDTLVEMDLNDLPSIYELESALRHCTPGKSMGLDSLPPELMHRFPQQMADLVWPLFAKQSVFCCESLQHKGGSLVAAYKRRGDVTQCSSQRWLLVSSSLGKAFHTVYRRRLMPAIHDSARSLQYTSHRSPIVTMASHTVRAFMNASHRSGRSSFGIFVDITEAYYRVIRQHAIHACCNDQDIMAFLVRMGITDMNLTDVANLYHAGPAIDELNVRPHLAKMITEIHRDSWFLIRGDDRPVVTERGTRPGDGFAGVLWELVFRRWISQIESDLYDLEIFKDFSWNQGEGLRAGAGTTMVRQSIVTWADDVAILADTEDATQLLPKLKATSEAMINRLPSYGMLPNMKAGKTEAVVTPRGKNAIQTRRLLFNEMKCAIPLDTNMEEDVSLRLVPKYKHLGSYIAHASKQRPEIQQRVAQGHQTMKDYRTKLYHNIRVPLKQRIAVMRATALTATTYNIGSLGPMTQHDETLWHHGVIGLYRKSMAKIIPYKELQHMTDEEVLIQAEALSPAEELKLARLRAYAHYVQRNNPFHWMILGHERQWLELVQDDLKWMYSQIRGYTQHPEPCHDLDYWHQFIRTKYGRWQGVLRRVTRHSILQRKLRHEVHAAHQQILALLEEADIPVAKTYTQTTETSYRCLVCDASFGSYRGWAVHAFKKHQRVHPFRRLQAGKTCAACAHSFPTEARLARHFKNSKQCAATVAAQQWWPDLTAAFGSRNVNKEEAEAVLDTWHSTTEQTLPVRQGWAMTVQTREFLKAACRCLWTEESQEQDSAFLWNVLRQHPVAVHEIQEVQDAMHHYFADQQDLNIDAIFAPLYDAARTTTSTTQTRTTLVDQLKEMQKMDEFKVDPPERCRVKYRYVLHLYSGIKRDDDLHTHLLRAGKQSDITLFPISIDIVLSQTKGNLLDRESQMFWLSLSKQGAIHFVYGGPPCETWSVSRWRFYDTGEGPAPLRSGDDIYEEIWGWKTLRLRDVQQILCSNALLLFMLTIFVTQLISGGGALMEHPARPGHRQGRQPPSVWLLPIVQFFLKCQQVRMIHISQGYWQALSPKPTTFLVTTPRADGHQFLEWLNKHKATDVLPKPIEMGHCKGIYHTAKLKRYPGPLCAGLAELSIQAISQIPSPSVLSPPHPNQSWVDPVLDIALELRTAYESSANVEDGADFHEFNQGNN